MNLGHGIEASLHPNPNPKPKPSPNPEPNPNPTNPHPNPHPNPNPNPNPDPTSNQASTPEENAKKFVDTVKAWRWSDEA